MLSAFKGRINRKTYIGGSLIGVGILGIVCMALLVPLALIDLLIFGTNSSGIYAYVYFIVVLPISLFCFYFLVLTVRRAHDLGYPGILLALVIFGLLGLAKISDIWVLNLLVFLLIGAFCLMPGENSRNRFGAKPGKNFKLSSLKIEI